MSSISSALLCTIVFIFFLLPGFIFLQGLFHSKRGALNTSNFYTYLFWGTFTSLILYSLSYTICITFSICDVSLDEVYSLLISTSEKTQTIVNNATTTIIKSQNEDHIRRLNKTIKFCLISNILSLFFLFITKVIIVVFKLDTLSPTFRFSNPWFYVLTGRKSESYSIKYKDFAMEAHIMCEISKSLVVYKGVVVDYRLKDETLDYICLTKLSRTGISEWEEASKNNASKPISWDIVHSAESNNYQGTITEKSVNPGSDTNKKEILRKINLEPAFYPFGGKVLFRAGEIKNFFYQYCEINIELNEADQIEKEKIYQRLFPDGNTGASS